MIDVMSKAYTNSKMKHGIKVISVVISQGTKQHFRNRSIVH